MKLTANSTALLTIPALALVCLLNLSLDNQLKQLRQARAQEDVIAPAPDPEEAIPAHVLNIAERYLAGDPVDQMQLEVLGRFIVRHPGEWNAWRKARQIF